MVAPASSEAEFGVDSQGSVANVELPRSTKQINALILAVAPVGKSAVLTGIGIIWILSRMNLRRIAGYALFWDVAISAGLAFVFVGTYAGMVTGVAAGVLVSLFLSVVKKVAGAERVKLVRRENEVIAKPRWREVK